MGLRRRPAAIAAALLLGGALLAAPPGEAATGGGGATTTLALIGDVPYGVLQEGTVGSLVQAVDGDPAVEGVVHVGDIKSGDTTCSDERFAFVRTLFDSFDDPLAYTPGDNEWTDCHRANNGGYDPLERLEAVRSVFFDRPGRTLGGQQAEVAPQAGMVENVRWVDTATAFATLHVVGSDNGLGPWTGLGHTSPTPAQAAEVADRIAKAVAWVDETFDVAGARGLRGVVLFMQADTFQPGPSGGQRAVVDAIARRTAAFPGEVLLVQGDTHAYRVDQPLGLPNLTRIVVHGATTPYEYLRLTVDPKAPAGQLFRWQRVQVAGA